VVVDVAEVDEVLSLDVGGVAAGDLVEQVALGEGVPAEDVEVALEVQQLIELAGARVEEDVVLQLVGAVLDLLQQRK